MASVRRWFKETLTLGLSVDSGSSKHMFSPALAEPRGQQVNILIEEGHRFMLRM